MPTYQYACTSCGHKLEAVQSFSDEPLTVCPECEGRLRKLFSSVGIVFKGSGFYRTDSRQGTKSDSSSGTPTAASSSDKSSPDKSSSDKSSSAGKSSGDSSSAGSSTGKSGDAAKKPAPAAS